MMKEYHQSIQFGTLKGAKKKSKNKNKYSLYSGLPVNNKQFEIDSVEQDFAENGVGYASIFYIFKYTIFFILLILIPLSVIEGITYFCGGGGVYEIKRTSNGHQFTKLMKPESKIFTKDHGLHSDPSPNHNYPATPLSSHRFIPQRQTKEKSTKNHDFLLNAKSVDSISSLVSNHFLKQLVDQLCKNQNSNQNLDKNHVELSNLCTSLKANNCLRKSWRFSFDCFTIANNFYRKTEIDYRKKSNNFMFKVSTINTTASAQATSLDDTLLILLHSCAFAALVLYIVLIKIWDMRFTEQTRKKYPSIKDLSIELYNLPYQDRRLTREEIRNSISQAFESRGFTVKNLSFALRMKGYKRLCQKIDAKQTEIAKQVFLKNINQEPQEGEALLDKSDIEIELSRMQDERTKLETEATKSQKLQYMTERAFVTLQSDKEKDECLSKYEMEGFWKNFSDLIIPKIKKHFVISPKDSTKRRVYLTRTENPGSIYWENLKYSEMSQFMRVLALNLIILVILGIIHILLYRFRINSVRNPKRSECLILF